MRSIVTFWFIFKFFFLKKIVAHGDSDQNFHVDRILCADVQWAPSHPLTYVTRKKRENES